MERMFKNVEWQKNEQDWKVKHGKSEDGTYVEGIRRIRPLANNNEVLGAGSIYATKEGTYQVYSGQLDFVDYDVWKHDIEISRRRKEQVELIMNDLLDASDATSSKFLGAFWHNLLCAYKGTDGQKAGRDAIKKYMRIDGYTDIQVNDIFAQIGWDKEDGSGANAGISATPNSIQMMNSHTPQYTLALMKMRLIIQYCPLVLTGREKSINPDAAAGVDGTTLLSTFHGDAGVNEASHKEVIRRSGKTIAKDGSEKTKL